MKRCILAVISIPMVVGCTASKGRDQAAPTPQSAHRSEAAPTPSYLKGKPDALYARAGSKIVKAPPEDLAVARGYAAFPNKGALHGGRRITIMSAKREYRVGETVRVVHVLEALTPGYGIHVMGPKPVLEEYVNGKLVSPPRGGLTVYDGAVVASPGVDFNYEVSRHTFTAPGKYEIVWRGGGHPIEGDLKLRSNTLEISVVK